MISPTIALLRGLLIADAAIFVLVFLLGLFSGVMIGAGEQSSEPVQSTIGESVATGFSCLAIAIGIPAYLGGIVGIFLHKNWGRWLYVGQLVLFSGFSLAISLFDFSASWAFPTALADIGSVLSGLIIGLTFYSPLAAEFEQGSSVCVSGPAAKSGMST